MNTPEQNLYIKTGDNKLVRTENFPVVSLAIGKYVTRIFYVPDEEFNQMMTEIGQEPIREYPVGSGEYIDNKVITVYGSTNAIDCWLRPDSGRERDREKMKEIKEDKAKGLVLKIIRDN